LLSEDGSRLLGIGVAASNSGPVRLETVFAFPLAAAAAQVS
jgi:hypothetical protein